MPGRLAACALISATLTAGCGAGAATTTTRGRRFVLRPGPDALAHIHASLPQLPPTHAPTKAEVAVATARLRSFVNAHCPCEFEQTASEIRLLHERHP